MIFKTTELWPVKEFPLKAWHKFFPREYLIKYKLLIHILLVMDEHWGSHHGCLKFGTK